MLYYISVTVDDISNGIQNSLTQNPIALSVKRCLGDLVDEVNVTNNFLKLRKGFCGLCELLPEYISDKSIRFEKYGKMEPFSFEIEFEQRGRKTIISIR